MRYQDGPLDDQPVGREIRAVIGGCRSAPQERLNFSWRFDEAYIVEQVPGGSFIDQFNSLAV